MRWGRACRCWGRCFLRRVSRSFLADSLQFAGKAPTLVKLAELRLNILSASLIWAFLRVAVPGPLVVEAVVAPLM